MPSAVIQAADLTKVFPGPDQQEVWALGPLNLTVEAGEFVSILGPSGCGKSTLLRLLARLEAPTGGVLRLADDAEAERPFDSMVFQGDSTFPWMTVHGNVEYGLRMRGVSIQERDAVVGRMLQTVGLTRFAEAYPYQLSGGMRQRVALARALANDPQVLLMDEPFGALDAQNRNLLQDELLQIWEGGGRRRVPGTAEPQFGGLGEGPEGAELGFGDPRVGRKTVIFVTHSIEEALVLGDRVLVMSAAPGCIKEEVLVPFARPRRPYELRRDPQFGELSYHLWQVLRDEVNSARLAEYT